LHLKIISGGHTGVDRATLGQDHDERLYAWVARASRVLVAASRRDELS
jgi:hypothetical protein